jgi:uncharacterized membrane protein
MIFFSNKTFQDKKLLVVVISICLISSVLVIDNLFAASTDTTFGGFWLWKLLGRFHPLVVHFPIGLLVFAALFELFTLKNFNSNLRPAINLMLLSGIATASLSVVFGLFLSAGGDYGRDLLALHQWIGVATFFLGTTAWFLHRKIFAHHHHTLIKYYRGVLFTTAISVSVAGHFGASLTHGSDYLSSAFPWSAGFDNSSSVEFDSNIVKNDTSKLTAKQELELNLKVRAIFAHNCYKCHGPEKIKGDLRLDHKDLVFKGGENGPVIIPGCPVESELFRRISLPSNHEDLMPDKEKKLSDADIAVIEFWIKKGAPWPEGTDSQPAFRLAELAPRNPTLPAAQGDITNPIDRWTNQYFQKNKTAWPAVVDDKIFIKRVYLDIIGLLPKPSELDAFMKDTSADKRNKWIRQLLNREDDYTMHWLSFWNDALRNDYTGTGYITRGRRNITDWLYKSIKSNKPYDQFVKELISPSKESKGFIEGIKWRGVINASQRTEMQAAQNVSQVFLGLNLKCASCHNSFVSDWKLTDAYGFANIFADSSLEINRCDQPTGKFTNPQNLWKELGTIDSSATREVKMSQLAVSIIKKENGRLYRTLVNRIWAQMMGRGLVEPVDVMDNEAWSQDLLDWMAYNFQLNGSNIKELIFLIASSKTYQLPTVGFKNSGEIVAQEYMFKGMLRKRMSAEQFADAAATVFEPIFPDSIMMYKPKFSAGFDTSLHFFARASLVANNSFLTALGRPNRETVATNRESQANLLQAMELTNGERFNSMIKRGAIKWKQEFKQADVIIKEAYSRALGRVPSAGEFTVAKNLLGNNPSLESIEDFFWSMMLLPEFQIIY